MNTKHISITDTKEVKAILDKAVEVFNIPLLTLKGKSRTSNIQLVRMAVSNIARVENKIHYSTIANVINRDRSSIYHYEKQHKSWFITWKTYQKAYNLLYSSLYKDPKPSLNKIQLKQMLKKAGINNTEGKVSIIIESGTTSHTITTDYLEFSKNIEEIKELFKDYSYSVDINL